MKYVYVGNDAGVPGLPHEISDEEAARLGISDLLMSAIENGSYRPVVLKGSMKVSTKNTKGTKVNE